MCFKIIVLFVFTKSNMIIKMHEYQMQTNLLFFFLLQADVVSFPFYIFLIFPSFEQ